MLVFCFKTHNLIVEIEIKLCSHPTFTNLLAKNELFHTFNVMLSKNSIQKIKNQQACWLCRLCYTCTYSLYFFSRQSKLKFSLIAVFISSVSVWWRIFLYVAESIHQLVEIKFCKANSENPVIHASYFQVTLIAVTQNDDTVFQFIFMFHFCHGMTFKT